MTQCKHTPGFYSVWAEGESCWESFADNSGAITIPLSNLHEYLDRYGALVPVRWLRQADV
jgi:hypothetical protein